MIYYKCNVGYSDSEKPTNLSQITFLDLDVPFVIATTTNFVEHAQERIDTLENAYKQYIEVIGEDVIYVYNRPPYYLKK